MDTFCSCLDWMLVIGCCLSFAFSYADPLSGRLMRCMLCVKQRLIQGPTKVTMRINQMHQGKVALATFFMPTTAEILERVQPKAMVKNKMKSMGRRPRKTTTQNTREDPTKGKKGESREGVPAIYSWHDRYAVV